MWITKEQLDWPRSGSRTSGTGSGPGPNCGFGVQLSDVARPGPCTEVRTQAVGEPEPLVPNLEPSQVGSQIQTAGCLSIIALN